MYGLPNQKLMPFQFFVVDVLFLWGWTGKRASILGEQMSNSRQTGGSYILRNIKNIFIFGNRVTSQFISGEQGNSCVPSHGRASKLDAKKSRVSDVQTMPLPA